MMHQGMVGPDIRNALVGKLDAIRFDKCSGFHHD